MKVGTSPLRFVGQMSDGNSMHEAECHYRLSSVSLVLLKGRSARPDIPINSECHFNMEQSPLVGGMH